MSNLWITIIFTVATVGIFVIALWLMLISKARRIEREIKNSRPAMQPSEKCLGSPSNEE